VASFRDYSIRRKLMVITMVTSGVVLVLGSVGFVAADFVTFRRRVVADLYGLAQMIEVNAATGLIFNDRQTAAQLLGALKAQPRILQGAIYDRDGRRFASYGRDDTEPPPDQRPNVTEDVSIGLGEANRIVVARPIRFNERDVGWVYLVSDTEEITGRLQHYALMLGIMVPSLFVIGFVLSSRLQRAVSTPILQLADIARNVSERKDYSIRATKHGGDELGMLVDALNGAILTQFNQVSSMMPWGLELSPPLFRRPLMTVTCSRNGWSGSRMNGKSKSRPVRVGVHSSCSAPCGK
jgi:uncharacterized membrane protein affecting hemolysin expression